MPSGASNKRSPAKLATLFQPLGTHLTSLRTNLSLTNPETMRNYLNSLIAMVAVRRRRSLLLMETHHRKTVLLSLILMARTRSL